MDAYHTYIAKRGPYEVFHLTLANTDTCIDPYRYHHLDTDFWLQCYPPWFSDPIWVTLTLYPIWSPDAMCTDPGPEPDPDPNPNRG